MLSRHSKPYIYFNRTWCYQSFRTPIFVIFGLYVGLFCLYESSNLNHEKRKSFTIWRISVLDNYLRTFRTIGTLLFKIAKETEKIGTSYQCTYRQDERMLIGDHGDARYGWGGRGRVAWGGGGHRGGWREIGDGERAGRRSANSVDRHDPGNQGLTQERQGFFEEWNEIRLRAENGEETGGDWRFKTWVHSEDAFMHNSVSDLDVTVVRPRDMNIMGKTFFTW